MCLDRRKEVRFKCRVIELLESIEQAVQPPSLDPAVTAAAKFERKVEKMPLTIQLNVTDEKYFVIGTDKDGNIGAKLGPGQTISVVSADTTIVTVTPDASPLPDNEGTPSIASGSVGPVKIGGPVDVTWTVTNADGSVAETDTDTVTVIAVQPGVATTIGVLFEEPTTPGTAKSTVKK